MELLDKEEKGTFQDVYDECKRLDDYFRARGRGRTQYNWEGLKLLASHIQEYYDLDVWNLPYKKVNKWLNANKIYTKSDHNGMEVIDLNKAGDDGFIKCKERVVGLNELKAIAREMREKEMEPIYEIVDNHVVLKIDMCMKCGLTTQEANRNNFDPPGSRAYMESFRYHEPAAFNCISEPDLFLCLSCYSEFVSLDSREMELWHTFIHRRNQMDLNYKFKEGELLAPYGQVMVDLHPTMGSEAAQKCIDSGMSTVEALEASKHSMAGAFIAQCREKMAQFREYSKKYPQHVHGLVQEKLAA